MTTKLTIPDLQMPQLSQLAPNRWLLHPLHPDLGIPATLHQPTHPVLPAHLLSHRRALRAQLGDGAIQVQAVAVHRLQPAGHSAGHQPVLAILYPAHRVQHRVRQTRGGCAERRGG